jgi:hypothetical protein
MQSRGEMTLPIVAEPDWDGGLPIRLGPYYRSIWRRTIIFTDEPKSAR